MERIEKYEELFKNYLNIKKSVKEHDYLVVNKEGRFYEQHKECGRNNPETRGWNKESIR